MYFPAFLTPARLPGKITIMPAFPPRSSQLALSNPNPSISHPTVHISRQFDHTICRRLRFFIYPVPRFSRRIKNRGEKSHTRLAAAAAGYREPNHVPMEEEQRRVGRTAAAGLTFWTLCPYCYYAHEYEKAYEGCCLRCATCRRGFHAAAIRAPPEATAFGGGVGAERNGAVGGGGGGGHYKCRWGLFRLRYESGARKGRGKGEGEEEKIDEGDYLVEISSEDEGGEAKEEAEVEEEQREEEESGGELELEYERGDVLVSP